MQLDVLEVESIISMAVAIGSKSSTICVAKAIYFYWHPPPNTAD